MCLSTLFYVISLKNICKTNKTLIINLENWHYLFLILSDRISYNQPNDPFMFFSLCWVLAFSEVSQFQCFLFSPPGVEQAAVLSLLRSSRSASHSTSLAPSGMIWKRVHFYFVIITDLPSLRKINPRFFIILSGLSTWKENIKTFEIGKYTLKAAGKYV